MYGENIPKLETKVVSISDPFNLTQLTSLRVNESDLDSEPPCVDQLVVRFISMESREVSNLAK